MNEITQTVGGRIRALRNQRSMTQEELAEKAMLHPTYIGQVERGEKNLTLTSLEKLISALGVSFAGLFEDMETTSNQKSIAAQCYEIVSQKTPENQEKILNILLQIDSMTK